VSADCEVIDGFERIVAESAGRLLALSAFRRLVCTIR